MSYSQRDPSTLLDMLLLAQDVREFVTAMPFEVFSGDKKTKAHEYDKVDLPLVWHVVTSDVPQLIQNLTPLVPAEPPAVGEQG